MPHRRKTISRAMLVGCLLIGCGPIIAKGVTQPAPATSLRTAEALLTTPTGATESAQAFIPADFPRKDVQYVLAYRLDKRLTHHSRGIQGRSYLTPVSDGVAIRINLIELTYSNETAARTKLALVCAHGTYFRNSKILIPFVAVSAKNQVLIGFSEQTQSPRVASFYQTLRKDPSFKQQPGCGGDSAPASNLR